MSEYHNNNEQGLPTGQPIGGEPAIDPVAPAAEQVEPATFTGSAYEPPAEPAAPGVEYVQAAPPTVEPFQAPPPVPPVEPATFTGSYAPQAESAQPYEAQATQFAPQGEPQGYSGAESQGGQAYYGAGEQQFTPPPQGEQQSYGQASQQYGGGYQYQQQPPQYGYYGPPQTTHTPSLVLGIFGIIGALFIPIGGIVCGIIGIVLAQRNKLYYKTTAGLVMSIVAIPLSIVSWILSVVLLSSMGLF